MTNLIERLAAAIFKQEGMSANALNPGNLRAAPWRRGVAKIVKGYWKPASRAEGVAGAVHQIALNIARGYSLRTLITGWAPPNDRNPTEQYIANVQEWAHIPDADTPLWDYFETEPKEAR